MTDKIINLELSREIRMTIYPMDLTVFISPYYLIKDKLIEEEDFSIKEFKVLLSIFHSWKIELQNLKNEHICYLPIEFEDEYIGCLKAELANEFFIIEYGFTQKIMGMAINPSNIYEFKIDNSDFESNSEKCYVGKDALLNDLEEIEKKILSNG